MIEFWINFIIATLMGTVNPIAGTSGMSSDNPYPVNQVIYEWPCYTFENGDKEMCFAIVEDGKLIETGP